MFTREQFCRDLLAWLGNSNASPDIVRWMVGWTCKETLTNSGAKFNLLNTTEPWANSTDFNTVHVKNYASYTDGVSATGTTVKNGYYPHINQSLANNDTTLLGDNPATAILGELSTWSGSNASQGYGLGLTTLGDAHMADTFDYGNPPGPLPPTPIQIACANKRWNSVIKPAMNTGIYGSWLQLYTAGIFYGPPLTWEYSSVDWHGVPIVVQEFAYGWVEWYNNGSHTWFK